VRTDGAIAVERLMALQAVPGFTREVIGWQRGLPITFFHRDASCGGAGRICVSAGIHGDEAAGTCALVGLLAEGFDFCGLDAAIFPALSPDGLRAGSRTNFGGVDLNRDYREPKTDEVRAHLEALSRLGQLDLGICLHEDWEAEGSYIYENVKGHGAGMADELLGAMAAHIAPDGRGEIDGMRAEGGIIRPNLKAEDFMEWPEAIFLWEKHCPAVYTLETPSGLRLEQRVEAHCAAVRIACRLLIGERGHGAFSERDHSDR